MTRPYPTVSSLKAGTKFEVNGREYQLLRQSPCSALVQLCGETDRRVKFKDDDGNEVEFTRSGSGRMHIGPTTEYEKVTGWSQPPAEKETRV